MKSSEKSFELKEDQWERYAEDVRNVIDPERMPTSVKKLSNKEQFEWMNKELKNVFEELPSPLVFLLPGMRRPGDCGRPLSEKPDWLDMDKFQRGQKFARNNFFATTAAALCGFVMTYSYHDNLRPIVMTQKSSTVYSSIFRYLRNVQSMLISYESNPWVEGTEAYKDVQKIRMVHDLVRKKFSKLSLKEMIEATTIENACCPMRHILMEDFRASCPAVDPRTRPYVFLENKEFTCLPICQMDMSLTQFGFFGLLITYPEYFGISSSRKEEMDAFCHFWRGMGYLLGTEDEYNFCGGTFKEVQERAKALIEYQLKPNLREISREWEHITRCFVTGVHNYVPLFSYEVALLYIGNMLGIPMSHLQASVSYIKWFQYKLVYYYFFYISKIPMVIPILNRFLHYNVEKYLNCSENMDAQLKETSEKIMASFSVKNH